MNLRILTILVCFFIGGVQAQNTPKKTVNSIPEYKASHFGGDLRTCHTMEADARLRSQYPQMPSLEQYNQKLNTLVEQYKLDRALGRAQAELLVIPVVVHVVHNGQEIGVSPNISSEQVYSQIDVMNEDFRRMVGTRGFNDNPVGADIEIEFALALVDPEGNSLAEPGINRINNERQFWVDDDLVDSELKPGTIWDPNRYLNMWTVDFGPNSDLLGYAQFPSSSNLPGLDEDGGPANTDGVVMRYTAFGRVGDIDDTYNLGRTTTHEVGHWLGLRHIWGDGGCGEDDFCADTPLAGEPNFECDPNANSCTSDNLKDMIENYMDYTPDACMNIFTADQKTRMRAVMDISPRRKELKTSTVHIGGPAAPTAKFTVSRKFYCSGQSISFTDQSVNSPTSWNWKFFNEEDQLITSSTAQNPSISLPTMGYVTVELTATNAIGSHTITKEKAFALLNGSALQSPWTDDLESGNSLSEWFIYDETQDDITWAIDATVSAHGVGSKSIVMNNFTTNIKKTRDWLISPALNLVGIEDAQFSFDYAYAQYSNTLSDTLAILYSPDCGQSWATLTIKGGSNLATAPQSELIFSPEDNQWASMSVDLSSLEGSEIYLALVNRSGYGNMLYLDNFAFESSGEGSGNPPTANFTVNETEICIGEEVAFTDQSTGGANAWSWSFEGGSPANSNLQNPSVSYSAPGTYSVSLTVSNSNGSHNKTTNAYIVVNASPTLNLTSNEPDGLCPGNEVTLSAEASNGSSVVWKDLAGNILHQGADYTFEASFTESYQAEATGTANCVSVQNIEQVVFVLPEIPQIDFDEDEAMISVQSDEQVQWFFEGELIGGAEENQYFPTADGLYMVSLTTEEGCVVFSEELLVEVLFLGELDAHKNQLLVYPNPAQGQVILAGLDSGKDYLVNIIDTKGSVSRSVTYQEGNTLDLSTLAPGLYTLMVQSDTRVQSARIIKQ